MELFLMISLLVVALLLIGIILIQQGKGAEMGASFGSGASNTLFGAPGSGNFLTKSTTVLAIIFFAISLAIAALKSSEEATQSSLLDDAAQTEAAGEGASSTEIPSEANTEISTEIPAETQEEISTEIPSEDAATESIPESIDAAADKAEESKKDGDNQ